MRRETKDNILMVILGITFFLNITAINLFPPTIEELVIVGWTTLGIGALSFVLSVFTLRRKGTRHVVDSGIYSIVRHPMYLGGLIFLFGLAIILANIISFIMPVFFFLIMNFLCIPVEESIMNDTFKGEYKEYKNKVRRWL